nr:MAG TPA: hypothetical protein [Caudoviricetes sp.]
MSKAKMNLSNVTVIFAKEEDKKSTVSVAITEAQRASIMDKIAAEFGADALEKADWTPVKESEKNGLYVKATTSYPVSFFENGRESDDVSSVDQIGRDAIVDINISIGETKFRRERGFTAFLSAVNIREFGDTEKYNPFAE